MDLVSAAAARSIAAAPSIAAILMAFGLIVLFHEAGHFLAARASGMAVHEFSIGFGRPLLFSFRRGQTQYSFRLWPFFSYVRVAGMEPDDDHPQGFHRKSRLAQGFVLVTGSLMNFVLAIGIYIFMGAVIGLPVAEDRIEEIIPDTPAASADVQPGDRLIGVNGRLDLSLDEIRERIQRSPGKPIDVAIERDGDVLTIEITPAAEKAYELKGLKLTMVPMGLIGVRFHATRQRKAIGESVVLGFKQTIGMIQLQAAGLVGMIRREVPASARGPVGVVHTMYSEAQSSWSDFLAMFALIAIAIGFLNLLPVPPLDGSRLVIVALEAVRRKPFDKQKEGIVHVIGFGLILALVVLLTYQDIVRILTGGG
jgi:regulator of sigma E protease